MSSNTVKIAWFGKHHGEEPPISGNEKQGAGTIFFTGCNLACVYCQNYQISQQGIGKIYNIKELVKIMLDLEENGAINIDLVTPTIWWKQIIEAIFLARKHGLQIPIVWNSNAYEDLEILKQVEDVVDIYLPDFKYADDNLAFRYSKIKNYTAKALAAIKEMLKQKGNFQEENGVGKKGVIVRHLILPGHLNNTFKVLEELAKIDTDIFIGLMCQYYPCLKAENFPEINRKLTTDEFNLVLDKFDSLEFKNGWIQEFDSAEEYLPDFNLINPFDNKK